LSYKEYSLKIYTLSQINFLNNNIIVRFNIIKTEEVTPFKSKCFVISHSHRLNKEAFSLLMSENAPFIVSDIKERSFLITITNKLSNCNDIEHFVAFSSVCISTFIMALNIESSGYFTWDWFGFSMRTYEVYDPIRRINIFPFLLKMEERNKYFEGNIKEISENEIRNTLKYYGVLTKDKTISTIREEYIKGILHLSLTFFNIDFYKEAFYNFYRCFENIVTNKVLQVEKLDKEVKNIEKAINKVGLEKIFTKQFIKSLYSKRSNQVMHAQKKQVNITLDDVYEIKICLEALLLKVFDPILEKALRDYRGLKNT
jgi:hypothetical protein